jgi:pimeloyl-ACP methyl ester carboxylesterase
VPRAAANGIEIEYETFGDAASPTMLLITGFMGQLIAWEDDFCSMLAEHDLHVVRFDNRDTGYSTHLDGVRVDALAMAPADDAGRSTAGVPYLLSDMADDAVALLDHLGVQRAHVVGESMGGMIAQLIAIEHPGRVITLTSIMSHPGDLDVGQPDPEVAAAMLAPPPEDPEGAIAHTAEVIKLIGSPRYYDEKRAKETARAARDRMTYPEGAIRQYAAIMASPSRTDDLRRLDVPTLVIHGRADRVVPLSGGQRVAEVVPGANLLVLHDMGHDRPEPLWPLIVDAIVSHTRHAIG